MMGHDFHDLRAAIETGSASRVIPRWAVDFLFDVADGRVDVPATRHPLGFLCLAAWRGHGYGVCVHIWSDVLPKADPTTSGIHAHSWDLTSYVLYGKVGNEVFDLTGMAPTHRVFEIRSGAAGVDAVRGTARLVGYRRALRGTHQRGDIYTVRSGTFHASVVTGEAATVALGADQPGAVDLSLGGIHTADHDVRRWRCDPEETRCLAKAVTARISTSPIPSDVEDPCRRRNP